MLAVVVGVALVLVLVVAATVLLRSPKPPGKLEPAGTFEHEDPANPDAVAERKRDFGRLVATNRDIWVFSNSFRNAGTVLPIKAAVSDSGETESQADSAYTSLRGWLGNQLANVPDVADPGNGASWPVLERVVQMLSVSPGFEFMMKNRVPPMSLQAKYLLLLSKSGQVRVAWYSFVTSDPKPGATSGPFVAKMVTENLSTHRAGETYTTLRYTAKATRETDIDRYIGKHIPLILKGVDEDAWEPYMSA